MTQGEVNSPRRVVSDRDHITRASDSISCDEDCEVAIEQFTSTNRIKRNFQTLFLLNLNTLNKQSSIQKEMPPVQEHLTSPSVHDAPIYELHNALASFTSDLHFR